MGAKQSLITEEELKTYQELTSLNQSEILHAYRKFQNIDPLAFGHTKRGQISFSTVAETLPQLKVNPFRYRICEVFTSSESGLMHFEDFLELVSVMSDKAPLSTKIHWAFQIYDINEDDVICPSDLNAILDTLTGGKLSQKFKDDLIAHMLREADQDGDGIIGFQEFERIMTLHSGPDFIRTFHFQL